MTVAQGSRSLRSSGAANALKDALETHSATDSPYDGEVNVSRGHAFPFLVPRDHR